MRALGAERGAGRLFDAAQSPDQQRLAVHLMELFPEDAHLARLERAAASGDAGVRYQAGRALVCQRQTDAWEQIMRGLLAAGDERVRSWAIEGLGYSRRESARRALGDHLVHESSAALRKKLEKLLNT